MAAWEPTVTSSMATGHWWGPLDGPRPVAEQRLETEQLRALALITGVAWLVMVGWILQIIHLSRFFCASFCCYHVIADQKEL